MNSSQLIHIILHQSFCTNNSQPLINNKKIVNYLICTKDGNFLRLSIKGAEKNSLRKMRTAVALVKSGSAGRVLSQQYSDVGDE